MKKLYKNSSLRTIMFLVMSLVPLLSKAQLYIDPGGTIWNDDTIYVDGALENSGQVTNNVLLTLTGDFTVNPTTGVYLGPGETRFAGPGLQRITQPVTGGNYFGYLNKANTGDVIADGNIDADSVVFTTDGVIDLEGSSVICKIKSGLPTAIKGFSNLRSFRVGDVAGKLSRYLSLLNEWYAYPVSDIFAGYMRIDYNLSSFGVGGAGYVTVRLDNNIFGGIFFSKMYSGGFSNTYPGPCFVGTNSQLYQLTCLKQFGWNASGPTGHIYTIRAYANSCSSLNLGPSRIIRCPTGLGFWTSNIENVVGPITTALCLYSNWSGTSLPFIPGGPYSQYGDQAIASGDSATSTALPVELIDIQASAINNEYIQVTWQTASESDNLGFEVQQSTDAEHWDILGWVNGHGTTPKPNSYFWNDRTIVPNTWYYYRFKQVDKSGVMNFSKIVSAKIYALPQISDVYPNPSQHSRSLKIILPKENTITMDCFDATGKEIFHQSFLGIPGQQTISIADDRLSTGSYYLRIQIGDDMFTKKFIVQ